MFLTVHILYLVNWSFQDSGDLKKKKNFFLIGPSPQSEKHCTMPFPLISQKGMSPANQKLLNLSRFTYANGIATSKTHILTCLWLSALHWLIFLFLQHPTLSSKTAALSPSDYATKFVRMVTLASFLHFLFLQSHHNQMTKMNLSNSPAISKHALLLLIPQSLCSTQSSCNCPKLPWQQSPESFQLRAASLGFLLPFNFLSVCFPKKFYPGCSLKYTFCLNSLLPLQSLAHNRPIPNLQLLVPASSFTNQSLFLNASWTNSVCTCHSHHIFCLLTRRLSAPLFIHQMVFSICQATWVKQ